MESFDQTPETVAEVHVEVLGRLGVVTLDRPRALNALTHGMVRSIAAALDAWEHDPVVSTVLLTGAGERGFCAGGDVVAVHRDAVSGGTGALDFWRDEYTLNARIARYPKPIVALMHGLTLGGGVGLAGHARHRVVTDSSAVGMPETTIGFVPDVGGTWLLAQAPGETGTLLALTAAPTDAAGAVYTGLANTYVPAARVAELRGALTVESAEHALARLSEPAPVSPLADDREWIDACFGLDDVPSILAALAAAGQGALADVIASKSPSALWLTLASLRRARALPNLEAALVQEFRVSSRCLRMPDFAEGIRAQLIDKDRAPRWKPSRFDALDAAALERFFDPLPDDLNLPAPAA